MSKTSRHTNPKNYPEGTLARTLSKQEQRNRRETVAGRARKIGAGVAVAAGVLFVGHQVSEMDKAHKQDVAEEAAKDAIGEKRIAGVEAGTTIYLRGGVAVRTEPKIIRGTEEDRGNELLKVDNDELLVVSKPVVVENDGGKQFIALTLEDGRLGYVATEVFGQENSDGESFAIVERDESITTTSSAGVGSVGFDDTSATFMLGEEEVSTAQFMSPDEALDFMAKHQ